MHIGLAQDGDIPPEPGCVTHFPKLEKLARKIIDDCGGNPEPEIVRSIVSDLWHLLDRDH